MGALESNVAWGSSPTITFDFSYSSKREGTSQYYMVTVVCDPLTGSHYFGFPIYVDVKLAGTSAGKVTLKSSEDRQWSSAISYSTPWVEIPNKSTGTTALSIRIYSGSGSSRDRTYNYTLPVDPAVSTIKATDASIESTSIISITKYDPNFTTTVGYKLSSESSYTNIWTEEKHTSYGWTVPSALYSKMTNRREATVTLECKTYDGNKLLGTSYCDMTATTNSTKCQPEVTLTAKDIRTATVALTGNNQIIILGASTLQATLTAKARNSATLVSSGIVCGSQIELYGANGSITKSFAKADSATVSSSTKDTRDYVTWAKRELSPINYFTPTAVQTIERESPTSDVVNVTVKGAWFNGSFGATTNSLTVKLRHKPKGQESYGTSYVTLATTSNGNEYTASCQLTGIAYTEARDVEIVITDKLHNGTIEPSVVKYDEVRKGIPIFDWGEDDFNINGTLFLNGTLDVGEEVQKTNKCVVKKSWWSSAGVVLDTGITAKGESYGKTVLMVLSAHSGSGTATTSEVGMIWCGFDSGTIVYTCLAAVSAGGAVSSQFTFSVNADGNICLKGSNRGVISMTAIISD